MMCPHTMGTSAATFSCIVKQRQEHLHTLNTILLQIWILRTNMSTTQMKSSILSKKSILAGKCGEPGNRVGEIKTMLLNKPQSVVYYRYSSQAQESEQNMEILLVQNQTCNISQENCILTEQEAEMTDLTLQNFRASPQIILFPESSQYQQTQKQYLFVSDTGNHCIKRIDMIKNTSVVVAGQCGESGFMDGPMGFNLLNSPGSLGITREGILYFYDLGNQYMRRVNADGQVVTLLNGSCKQFSETRNISNYQMKSIICYKNWIEGTTKAETQHVLSDQDISVCTEHSSKC